MCVGGCAGDCVVVHVWVCVCGGVSVSLDLA